jgi:hypothetical protein
MHLIINGWWHSDRIEQASAQSGTADGKGSQLNACGSISTTAAVWTKRVANGAEWSESQARNHMFPGMVGIIVVFSLGFNNSK